MFIRQISNILFNSASRSLSYLATHPLTVLTSLLYAQSKLSQAASKYALTDATASLQATPTQGYLCGDSYLFDISANFQNWEEGDTELVMSTPFFTNLTRVQAPANVFINQTGNMIRFTGNLSQLSLSSHFNVANVDNTTPFIPLSYTITSALNNISMNGNLKINFPPINIYEDGYEFFEGFAGDESVTYTKVLQGAVTGIPLELVQLIPLPFPQDPYLPSIRNSMSRIDKNGLAYVNLTIPYDIAEGPFSNWLTGDVIQASQCYASRLVGHSDAGLNYQIDLMFAVNASLPVYATPMNKTNLFNGLQFTNLDKYPNGNYWEAQVNVIVQISVDDQLISLGSLNARDLQTALLNLFAYVSCDSPIANLNAIFYRRDNGYGPTLGLNRTISLPIYAAPPLAPSINITKALSCNATACVAEIEVLPNMALLTSHADLEINEQTTGTYQISGRIEEFTEKNPAMLVASACNLYATKNLSRSEVAPTQSSSKHSTALIAGLCAAGGGLLLFGAAYKACKKKAKKQDDEEQYLFNDMDVAISYP